MHRLLLPDILYLQALSQKSGVSQSYIKTNLSPPLTPFLLHSYCTIKLMWLQYNLIVAHATCIKLIVIISSTRVQVTASMQTAELKSFENRN